MPLFGNFTNDQSSSTSNGRRRREVGRVTVVPPEIIRNRQDTTRSLVADDRIADLLGLADGNSRRFSVNELFPGVASQSANLGIDLFQNQDATDRLVASVTRALEAQTDTLLGRLGIVPGPGGVAQGVANTGADIVSSVFGTGASRGPAVGTPTVGRRITGITGTSSDNRDTVSSGQRNISTTANTNVSSLASAIGAQESGFLGSDERRYRAVGPVNSGGRGSATGYYQFLDSTWQREARELGYTQYRSARDAPPAVQDAVANNYVNQLLARYGDPQLVAIAWHAGEGTANRAERGESIAGVYDAAAGIATSDYARQVLGRL